MLTHGTVERYMPCIIDEKRDQEAYFSIQINKNLVSENSKYVFSYLKTYTLVFRT